MKTAKCRINLYAAKCSFEQSWLHVLFTSFVRIISNLKSKFNGLHKLTLIISYVEFLEKSKNKKINNLTNF